MLTLNKLKKIIFVVFMILILLQAKTFAVVSQTKEFYVNDYAEVLSTETEDYIINTNIELEKKTGAQIVVVTVKSIEGQSIEEYATELFRKFGIGDKNKNNGVLLLCSTEDRLFRIEVGYGLEGRLTDGKTGRIQDEYIIPYLKNDNYDEGIKNGFSAVLQEVSQEYGVTVSGVQKITKAPISISTLSEFGTVSAVITYIINVILRGNKTKNILKINSIYMIVLLLLSYILFGSSALIILVINLIIIFIALIGRSRSRRLLWRRTF